MTLILMIRNSYFSKFVKCLIIISKLKDIGSSVIRYGFGKKYDFILGETKAKSFVSRYVWMKIPNMTKEAAIISFFYKIEFKDWIVVTESN